jgi:predicted TIM-barrel fold metal-dependent hydrolase
MIIDSHFHIYKNEQAGLLAQGGQSHMGFSGTLEEARKILDGGQIDKIIALAVIPIEPMRQAAIKKWPHDISPSDRDKLSRELEITLRDRLSRYNDWICSAARDDKRIEPAIAADPTIDKNEMAAEILDKLERYQIRAIKIHPEVNSVFPTHQGYQPVFELAQQKGLAVISHGGLSASEKNYCAPENFHKVLENFPKLKLVIAHLAFPQVKTLIEMASRYQNLYTDISFIMSNSLLNEEELCQAIRDFGTERVLFGSDMPWADPEKDSDRLGKLKLNDNELEMLTWKNATSLFELT